MILKNTCCFDCQLFEIIFGFLLPRMKDNTWWTVKDATAVNPKKTPWVYSGGFLKEYPKRLEFPAFTTKKSWRFPCSALIYKLVSKKTPRKPPGNPQETPRKPPGFFSNENRKLTIGNPHHFLVSKYTTRKPPGFFSIEDWKFKEFRQLF